MGTKVVIPETLAYSILGNSSSDSGLWVNLSLFALLCLCQDGFIWGHPSLFPRKAVCVKFRKQFDSRSIDEPTY